MYLTLFEKKKCSNCQKKGHFKKVCHGSAPQLSAEGTSAAMWRPMIAAASPSLAKSTTTVSINSYEAKALVDVEAQRVSFTLSW